MKKYLVILFLVLTAFLCQCKKSKQDDKAPNLKKGLLANFMLNDSFEDSTGNCETLVSAVSGVSPTIDRKGSDNAIFFDGGKFIFATDNWSVNPISVSVWLKCKNLSQDNLVLSTKPGSFSIHQFGSHLVFEVIPLNASPVANAKITTAWTHVVLTYDGIHVKVFINGQLEDEVAHKVQPAVCTQITVGSQAKNNTHWAGAIDDLRFYNRILTDEEISLLTNQ